MEQITTKPFTEEEQTKFKVALTRQLFGMLDDQDELSDIVDNFRTNILLDFRNSIDSTKTESENKKIEALSEKKIYENMVELESGFFLSGSDRNDGEVKKAKENKTKFMEMVKKLRENCGNIYSSYNKNKEYDLLFYMVDDLFNEIEELGDFDENRDIYITNINMVKNLIDSHYNDIKNKIDGNTNGYFLLELFYKSYDEIVELLTIKIFDVDLGDSFIEFQEKQNSLVSKGSEDEGEGNLKGGRSHKKNKYKRKRKRKSSNNKTLKKKRKNKKKSKK